MWRRIGLCGLVLAIVCGAPTGARATEAAIRLGPAGIGWYLAPDRPGWDELEGEGDEPPPSADREPPAREAPPPRDRESSRRGPARGPAGTRARPPRVEVRLGVALAHGFVEVEARENGEGGEINLVQAGLNRSTALGDGRFRLRLDESSEWFLQVGLWGTRWTGLGTMDEEETFEGTTYPAGERVKTTFEITTLSLDAVHTVLSRSGSRTDVQAGLRWTYARTELDGRTVGEETEYTDAFYAHVGMDVEWLEWEEALGLYAGWDLSFGFFEAWVIGVDLRAGLAVSPAPEATFVFGPYYRALKINEFGSGPSDEEVQVEAKGLFADLVLRFW